jgi:hypothetical protein
VVVPVSSRKTSLCGSRRGALNGSGQIERVKVGCATGGMHDQIGSHRLGLAVGGTVHKEAVRHFLDPLHRRPTHLDAEFAKLAERHGKSKPSNRERAGDLLLHAAEV